MTKQDDRRAGQALRQTQLRLKNAQLEIIADRLRREREDQQLRVALQLLAAAYSLTPWPDGTPLPEIVQHYLLGPLTEQVTAERARADRAERQLAKATAWIDAALTASQAGRDTTPAVPSQPRPRLAAVPRHEHRVLVVPVNGGYRATCTCPEKLPVCPTYAEAQRVGTEHEGRGPSRDLSRDRRATR